MSPHDRLDVSPARIRLILLALAAGGFAIGTTEFAAMSLLPRFADDLNLGPAAASHVISAYAAGVVIGAPTLAVAGARWGHRTFLIALMGAFTLLNAASAVAPGYGWMLALRFLSGLPHGAFFGVGALVAARLVPRSDRTKAVSRMLLGLTVATIVGGPLANMIGGFAGWRWGFALVAALAAGTTLMLWMCVPQQSLARTSPLKELSALANGQVWLTLATGAIGFGGMFAVYSFLASAVAGMADASVATLPIALALFGVGMTIGNVVCARAADRAMMPAIGGTLVFSAGACALYALLAREPAALYVTIILVGGGGGLGAVLQARLMDVGREAQTLSAALNHSAFNTANALGPWLAGIAIEGGAAPAATGWIGAALAGGGLILWSASWLMERRHGASFHDHRSVSA